MITHFYRNCNHFPQKSMKIYLHIVESGDINYACQLSSRMALNLVLSHKILFSTHILPVLGYVFAFKTAFSRSF